MTDDKHKVMGKAHLSPLPWRTKSFYENYQMDTPTKFEHNWSCGLREEIKMYKFTDDGHQVMIIPLITLKGLIFIQAHPYQYMKNTTQTKVCRPARCMSELFSQLSI